MSKINLATEKDKESGLDTWCRLFKAATWEELKSIAKEDTIMETVANDLYICDSDEAIQKRCEDREDYLREKRITEKRLKRLETVTAEIESLTSVNKNLASENKDLISENQRLRAILKAHNISDKNE